MAPAIEKAYRRLGELKPNARLLALEIRSQRFAFAILEGSSILDSGVRSFPLGKSGTKSGRRRFVFLVQLYAPSVVIARRTRRVRAASGKQAARIFANIRQELNRRSIPLVAIERTDLNTVFTRMGCRTKHEIAVAVAERFGELKPRLPLARKPWDPERKRVAVFDAIATAIAFNALR